MSLDKPWLKSYPAGVGPEVDLTQFASVVSVLEQACDRFRHRPAFHNMGRTLRYDVARKDVVSLFDHAEGMVVEAPMPARLRERPILDDEQLGAVVDAVLAVERHFGFPVDVEWVVNRHRRVGEPVTVVQARPETVRPEAPPTPTWDTAAMLRHAFGGGPR